MTVETRMSLAIGERLRQLVMTIY